MSMIIDGTNGLTFNNASTQASAGLVAGGTIATGTVTTLTTTTISDGTNSTSSTNAIQGSAKAWVKFDSTPTISNSFNVSSMTKISTGQYTVSLTTALPSVNAVYSGFANEFSGSFGGGQRVVMAYPISTSQVNIGVTFQNGGVTDCPINGLVVFSK